MIHDPWSISDIYKTFKGTSLVFYMEPPSFFLMNIQLLPPKVSCQICSIFQLYPAIKDMHPIHILASIADMYHIQVLWLLWGICAS